VHDYFTPFYYSISSNHRRMEDDSTLSLVIFQIDDHFKEQFALYGNEDDGRVHKTDLIALMESVGCNMTKTEWQKINFGKQGSVTFTQFMTMVAKKGMVCPRGREEAIESREDIRRALRAFDRNKTFNDEIQRYISAAELQNIMRIADQVRANKPAIMTKHAGASGQSNTQSSASFVPILSPAALRSNSPTPAFSFSAQIRRANGGGPCGTLWIQQGKNTKKKVRGTLAANDQEGTGCVSGTDLHCIMTELGEELSEAMLTGMINRMDINNEGQLNYEDFLKMHTFP
jgi:Ca2+-binding EF-hand superfamily protein